MGGAQHDGERVAGLKTEMLGRVSAPSTLTYLDNGVVYVGSSFGDSQLVTRTLRSVACMLAHALVRSVVSMPSVGGPQVRLHATPVSTAEPDNYVEVLETMTNLGPIIDFVVVDLERQGQGQVTDGAGICGGQKCCRIAIQASRPSCAPAAPTGGDVLWRDGGRLAAHRAERHWHDRAGGGVTGSSPWGNAGLGWPTGPTGARGAHCPGVRRRLWSWQASRACGACARRTWTPLTPTWCWPLWARRACWASTRRTSWMRRSCRASMLTRRCCCGIRLGAVPMR